MKTWHPLPASLYTFVEETSGSLLLESCRPGISSVSRIFTNPVRVIEARTPADVAALFPEIESAVQRGSFAAGYFSYECGEYFEPTASLRPGHNNDLLAWFGVYECCYSFDHTTGTFPGGGPVDSGGNPVDLGVATGFSNGSPPRLSFTLNEHEYCSRIARIYEWISAGDVYQLNFTFPVHIETGERPAALYARLRTAQPVDYGAFLHCQNEQHILSFSPELFFRTESIGDTSLITTRPMKGTVHRGRTNAEDRKLAAGLAADEKNRAENVMIVDLIRNDLGRICEFGSVRVDKLFEVERFATLWQMTSTVTGALRHDIGYEKIFRALFPCGSITGAPKVRAMQLLAQIEDNPRGIYTGAIGFFSGAQTAFNVAIRTLLLKGRNGTMGVGGGIVSDSEPESEFRECLLKTEFLTPAATSFSLIESILWKGGYPLIELHLDRLGDSAEYFDFSFDQAAVRASLIREASRFTDEHPRKVRLLLDVHGVVNIHSSLVPDTGDETGDCVTVCIAEKRTDRADRFLFHKTTRRTVYENSLAAAARKGFGEVLFLNTRSELTEGAISNVFVEKAGRWYTPPIDCGVLPGVYRRHLLETRPAIEEKILTLDDLASADAVYLCNAVRGLRQASVAVDTLVE